MTKHHNYHQKPSTERFLTHPGTPNNSEKTKWSVNFYLLKKQQPPFPTSSIKIITQKYVN